MNLGGEIGHVYMDMPPNCSELVAANVDVTDEIVEQTVKTASSLGCPVLVHAEDYESCGCGIQTAREKTKMDYLHGLKAVHLNLKQKQSKLFQNLDAIMIVLSTLFILAQNSF